MIPVKTVVDEQMKRLQETLVASLKRKVMNDVMLKMCKCLNA